MRLGSPLASVATTLSAVVDPVTGLGVALAAVVMVGTEILVNVVVFNKPSLWLVSANPIYAEEPIARVTLPTLAQVLPSDEIWEVKVLPVRVIFTQ